VLLQSGRGGGLAGALGGIGGAESALGVRAASQIEKATGVLAAIFLVLALALGFLTAGTRALPEVPEEKERGVVAATEPAGATPPATIEAATEPGGTSTAPGGAED
jgi:preprotein translocase subunit SecG